MTVRDSNQRNGIEANCHSDRDLAGRGKGLAMFLFVSPDPFSVSKTEVSNLSQACTSGFCLSEWEIGCRSKYISAVGS